MPIPPRASDLEKQAPNDDPGKAFMKHFSAAEGSEIQRFYVASAMLAIEDEMVQTQRRKLSTEDQLIFMMAYECFTMWAIKKGVELVLTRQEVEDAVIVMQCHFAKYAWYRTDVFERIWDRIQFLMPIALKPSDTGIVYPITEMIEAARQAGFPLDPTIGADLDFGMHVLDTLNLNQAKAFCFRPGII